MKKLLLLGLMLMLMTLAIADVYEIGTLGTSSSSTYGPVNGFYDFGWTKVIVTAAEMTTAGYNGDDDIVGIGYYVGNTPANYEILDVHGFIRTTALTGYSTTADETGTAMPDSLLFTQVFSGNLTFNGGGWFYVAFNLNNFNWDGVSNIEIFWKNWDGDYVTGYPTYRYNSQSPDYKTVYKQQDTTWPTTAGTRSTSRSNIALVTPQVDPPNQAILAYPTDTGWAFLDASLAWSDGGGLPTGYDVYLDDVDGSTLVSPNHPSTSYTPTLAAGTTYYWRVDPINPIGTTTGTVWSFTTPTIDQLAESFDDVSFPPVGWTNVGNAFARSTTSPFYGVASAYEYTATPTMMYTPMLELTATSSLDFWARASATTAIGRIQIKYSTDAVTWDPIGAEIAMPANSVWQNYVVDLSSLTGNYYIGFEFYSSTTTSAGIYLDHVFGPEFAALAPDPATLVYPSDTGWAFLDGILSWEAATTGGIPSGYDVYFDDVDGSTLVSTNQVENTYTPTLAASTTYYWKVVPRNSSGFAAGCPVWSFNTPTATQLAESFDATTFPPLGWGTTGFTRSTTTPFYGAACAYEYTTAATMLNTPLLAITGTSTLDFWARVTATTEIARIQVKYSDDGVIWNPVGTEIPMPPVTTWQNYVVDLSSLGGNNYFLAIEVYSSTTASITIYVDHVFGPEYAAVAPGPVALNAPADLAIDVDQYPTFTWSFPIAGGIPTGYKVYCDTNADPITLLDTVTELTYTVATPLTYSTVYYWKVVATNGTGDATGNEIRSFTVRADPTVYSFPWQEDFGTTGTTFPPANWERYAGLLADPISLTPNTSSSYWYYEDWLNTITDPVNYSACFEIWSTARNHWLVTPPIQMPGAGYQLELDLALTWWNQANPANPIGVDDKFAILIGDGVNWTTADIVRLWDNDPLTEGGIYSVYNDIATTGEHVIIPLDAYTGVKYIAFYGESSISNADNDLFVDNVLVRLTPAGAPDHVLLTSPADLADMIDPADITLLWSANITGGAPEYYEVFVGASPIDPSTAYYGEYLYETTETSLVLSDQIDIVLDYSQTWYWAVLPYNNGGAGYPNPLDPEFLVWRFTTAPDPTIIALPYEQYFDDVTAPVLPWGWSAFINSTSTSAFVGTYSSTTYAHTAPNSARLYNPSDASADLRLISPPIAVPLNTIKLKFFARSSGAGYPLQVGTVDALDGTGIFTELANLALTTTVTEYEISLDTYVGTDEYICFKHGLGGTSRSLYVDDVRFIELLDNDLAVVSLTGDGWGIAGQTLDYEITVYNEGLLEQTAYTVQLMDAVGPTILATLAVTDPLASGATAQHALQWTPPADGSYEVFGRVVLAGDQYTGNDDTAIKAVVVLPLGLTSLPMGNPETTTTQNYLPTNVYYKNGVTEMLYFPDEMHLTSGDINAILYKNNFTQELTGLAFKIWMGTTVQTDLSGGWIPADSLTLVFDGTLDFPIGINDVLIPLQTPFAYTGNNLVVRINRVMDTVYYNSTNVWYYTDTAATHANRSRYLQSDATLYDPLAPSAAGTLYPRMSNTTLLVENAVLETGAVMNGHVYEFGGTTPIEAADVTLTDERYSTASDIDGFYEFMFWEPHTVTGVASKFGYYDQTVTGIALTMGNTTVQDFYLTPKPRVTVSGVLTANDAPAGLEGATVALTGIENHSTTTGPGGVFSFADVLGQDIGYAYTLTITKEGYEAYVSTETVYEIAVDLGTININENAYTAYNLEAIPSGNDAQLVWDPAGVPDYYFTDFETDDGGWVASGIPDWEWTNTYNVANYVPGGYPTSEVPPPTAWSGTGLWGTVMYGPYAMSGSWAYMTQTFDLTGYTAPVLKYQRWNNLYYSFDYYKVKINGTDVVPDPDTAIDNNWAEKIIDLSAYEGMTSVEIQFAVYATTVVSYGGLYLDDIYVGPAARMNAPTQLASANRDRVFVDYSVYRLLAADEGTPGSWTLLASAVTDTSYLDTGFGALPGGSYEWAVVANYSAGLESDPIFSNALGIVETPVIDEPTVGASGTNVTLGVVAQAGADYYTLYGTDDPYAAWPWTIIEYSVTPVFTFPAGAVPYKFFKITASAGVVPPPPTRK